MSGSPKVIIMERDNTEFGYQAEYCLDLTDILPMTESMKTTYTDDMVTTSVYYRSATQTEANRVAQVDVTYNTDDYPSIVTCKLYSSTDGTTLLKTITLTYTWSDDLLDKVDRVIT